MKIKRIFRKFQNAAESTKVVRELQAISNNQFAELEDRLAKLEQMLKSDAPIDGAGSDVQNEIPVDQIDEMRKSGSMANEIAQWLERNSADAWKVSSPRLK